ncbi:hypothetical protein ACHAWF_013910, partial [Thalassiosira exigua]
RPSRRAPSGAVEPDRDQAGRVQDEEADDSHDRGADPQSPAQGAADRRGAAHAPQRRRADARAGPGNRVAPRRGPAPRRGHGQPQVHPGGLGSTPGRARDRTDREGVPRSVDAVPQAGEPEGAVARGGGRHRVAGDLRDGDGTCRGRGGRRSRVRSHPSLHPVGRLGPPAPGTDGEADPRSVGELPQSGHQPPALQPRGRLAAVERAQGIGEAVGRDQREGLPLHPIGEPHQEPMVQRRLQEVHREGVRDGRVRRRQAGPGGRRGERRGGAPIAPRGTGERRTSRPPSSSRAESARTSLGGVVAAPRSARSAAARAGPPTRGAGGPRSPRPRADGVSSSSSPAPSSRREASPSPSRASGTPSAAPPARGAVASPPSSSSAPPVSGSRGHDRAEPRGVSLRRERGGRAAVAGRLGRLNGRTRFDSSRRTRSVTHRCMMWMWKGRGIAARGRRLGTGREARAAA